MVPPEPANRLRQALKQNLDEVIFINDDKPLLYEAGDGLYVTGSPWSGKTSRNENVKMKVKAIVFIKQAPHNNLISLTVYDKITNFKKHLSTEGRGQDRECAGTDRKDDL